MKKRPIIIVVLLMVLIAIFVAAYQIRYDKAADKKPKTTHPVLVVDIKNNGRIDLEDLEEGTDALLVLQASLDEHHWLSSLNALIKFDLNHDQRIDRKDAIYPHIGLVYFPNDPEKQKYVSLKNAGVVAIVFVNERVTKISGANTTEQTMIGYALMQDGSKRKINVLQVEY